MKKIFTIIGCFMLVSACVKSLEERGYMSKFARMDDVREGISSKNEVINILGTPSTSSDFGEETWYYIATTSETVALKKPRLIEQTIWFVKFNEAGVVSEKGQYTSADARPIKFVKDKTRAEGNDFTIMQQFLGNLGRFNPKQ